MNMFEKVAQTITTRHGVHVEYVSVNREYVVEGCTGAGRSARKAEQLARKVAREANTYGVLGGMQS